MKTFNNTNITSTKSFLSACNAVFTGINGRNLQLQELLLVAVNEAAKVDKNDNPSNNLSWLSSLLVMAEQTNGINLSKIVTYVKEVLCCNTVKWDAKKQTLNKVNKDTKLEYCTNPMDTWFNHGKPNNLDKEFDYEASLSRALDKFFDKGNKTIADLAIILAKKEINVNDVMLAMEFANIQDDGFIEPNH